MKKYILAIVSLFIIGCAGNADMNLESTNIENGEYKISHIIVGNETLVAPQNATLGFEGDRIYGSTGCNNYFSSINWLDNGMLKTGYAGSTRMLCHDKDINNFENIYLQNLEGEFEVLTDGDTYTLQNENISIVLEK